MIKYKGFSLKDTNGQDKPDTLTSRSNDPSMIIGSIFFCRQNPPFWRLNRLVCIINQKKNNTAEIIEKKTSSSRIPSEAEWPKSFYNESYRMAHTVWPIRYGQYLASMPRTWYRLRHVNLLPYCKSPENILWGNLLIMIIY